MHSGGRWRAAVPGSRSLQVVIPEQTGIAGQRTWFGDAAVSDVVRVGR